MKTCPVCDTAYPNEFAVCGRDGARLMQAPELPPGTIIRGKYRIQRLVGRGGMGTVYVAEHMMLGRQRALKFMSSEMARDPKFLKRFRHEAQTAIELRHPSVVEVVDLDQAEDGTPYIAMEFVDGPDLRDQLGAGPLEPSRALAIARGVVIALAAAHGKGIVHRDLKPENILLARAGTPQEMPKLVDFGIAAMKDAANAISSTRGVMMTPEYAAPEQWRGVGADELDGRTDLYALGVVLYEMLTGVNPFRAASPEACMYQHLETAPEPPSAVRPELASWLGLDELVLKLLEKDRENRPWDAAATLALIDAVQLKQGRRKKEARPPAEPAASVPAKERKPLSRWIWVPLLTAGVVVAALGGLVFGISAPALERTGHQWQDAGHLTPALWAYQLSCARGDGHACSWLGYVWVNGVPGNSDTLRGMEYYARACQLGETSACMTAGVNYELGEGTPQNYPRAVALYARDCALGDPVGCARLGRMYDQGAGVEQNYARAVALYSVACDKDVADGCAGLARAYREGRGVKPNSKMADAMLARYRLLANR